MPRVSALNAAYDFRVTEFDVTLGPQQVAPNDPDRWALVFMAGSGCAVALGPTHPPTGTTGFFLTAGMGPVTFDAAKHPALAAAEWHAAQGMAGTLTVIEVFQSKSQG